MKRKSEKRVWVCNAEQSADFRGLSAVPRTVFCMLRVIVASVVKQ
jgi:hypothetical protein